MADPRYLLATLDLAARSWANHYDQTGDRLAGTLAAILLALSGYARAPLPQGDGTEPLAGISRECRELAIRQIARLIGSEDEAPN
jgi:hypothetical protein